MQVFRCVLSISLVLTLSGCGSGAKAPEGATAPGTTMPVEAAKPVVTQPAKPDTLSGKIVITGASTLSALTAELGKKFEKMHPNVRVDVQAGGSARGITDTRTGAADIGMCSRALKDDEKELHPFLVAMDGVCIILHKDNPVKELSDAQVIDIYLGKIVNWKEVGGPDAPITVVNKAEGRSTLELFCHFYKLKNSDIKAHVVIGDNEQGVKTVCGNQNAIGYVSVGTAEYDASQGVPIKLLATHGAAATLENVKNKSFPLSRELNLVTKAEPQGLAKAFIDFACSKDANECIKEQFFVPVKE